MGADAVGYARMHAMALVYSRDFLALPSIWILPDYT